MPVIKSLMASLRKRYGATKAEKIYYGMEAEGKGPFAKGNKYHDLHVAYAEKLGLKPIERKKPTRSKKPHRRRKGQTAMGLKRHS